MSSMERAYSHSRPPTFSSKKKPPPFSSSSSSSFHNNAGFFTSSYEDVFGGPPKLASSSSSSLAPRAEDYSEIFGAFRSFSRASSSIPVLDLPALPNDIHSASAAAFFDYSEVFGGFNSVDFAVPFHQLFPPCDASFCDADADADADNASSDDAWTPAGTESLSDDSDVFAVSDKSQCFSSENSQRPFESKQYNVSYHTVNPGTSTDRPNTMHVAQLNDVPGYTCLVSEATTLRQMGKEMCSPLVDNVVLSMASPSDLPQKNTKKNISHASYDGTCLKLYGSDRESGIACSGSISHMNSTSASVSDINLRTEPSNLPPPALADRNENFIEPFSGPLASESFGLEVAVDDIFPPFLDMEVDASSSSAASAAVMKDAMERADAKLKAAKELRNRKDKVQSSAKLHLETDVNGGENVQKSFDECLYGETGVHLTHYTGPSKMKNSANTRPAKNASKNSSGMLAVEQPNPVSEKPSETKPRKKCSLSTDTAFTDVACQWKEAREYYDFVNTNATRFTPQLPNSNGDEKAATKLEDEDDHNSDSAEEACATGKNRRRLKATRSVSRQEYYEKIVKVAQEVHESVICGHVKPDKKLKPMSLGKARMQKTELINEPEKYELPLSKAQEGEESPSEVLQKEEAPKRSRIVLEKEEPKKESEAFHSQQVDRNAKGPHESMAKGVSEADGEMRGSGESGEGDYRVQETDMRREHEQRSEKSFGENTQEVQNQDENREKLEKTTELENVEHVPLLACELERRGKGAENTSDKVDQMGVHRSHMKIEWEDEDQGPHSSPDIALPTEGRCLKSSNGTNLFKKDVELNKPQSNVDGFKEVNAQKENGDIRPTLSDRKSYSEVPASADLPIDGKHIVPTAVQLGPNHCELEERKIQASDTLDLSENSTKPCSNCIRNEETVKEEKKKGAQLASDLHVVKDLDVKRGRKPDLAEEGEVLLGQDEKVRSAPAEGTYEFNECASKEEVVCTVLPEAKEGFQEIFHLRNIGNSGERKGKIVHHDCFSEEKVEDKERDQEKDRLRKLEKERERLREREKDRMAVEVAVREARDRAFADARDRAERAALERATDEARQRAMAEARERLEKACAEARERSLADKTSEDKLRAERAAIERANAEARQRAIEKAMAERATFEARERMQRSVSEKYLSEREVIMRQSSFPTTSERFEVANSEPAERCKARLERHRRTVERVAKALAEKNMRDLLTQREQAERTRLAEALDADIKRWSSGKEGNLRALLSTLQYILGPDSGWQPIPLTEVITAAAVKKAYRKATLCVHPDKLQQRGATIQQKYICEKVFDLLKEAWNRFNSEEK